MNNYKFDIEKSRDNYNILKIYKNDKSIYMGSKYNMKNKIIDFINQFKECDDKSIFLIFGFGSGECIYELAKRFKNNKILIFEPNYNLIKYIQEDISKFEFLNSSNIELKYYNYSALEDLRKNISVFDITKIKYGFLCNYEKMYVDKFIEFNNDIKNFLSDTVLYRNTSITFAKRWFDTLMGNLPDILTSSPIDILKGKYKNIPAIIVSAGPSLEKNIHELKNINNRMIVLSGGRTLKPLKDIGVNPDLLGIIDPGEIAYELVKEYISYEKSTLLFYEGTNEKVTKYHTGNKYIFTQSKFIREIFEMNISDMSLGGSIAHALTGTAVLLGCNPIIFIGQDLAYLKEKRYGDIALTKFDKEKEITLGLVGGKAIKVKGVNGEILDTNEELFNFKRSLENIIKNNSDVTFINATEGGALIEGTINMSLKEVINEYSLKSKGNYIKENNHSIDISHMIDNTVVSLKNIIKSNKNIISKSKEALKYIELIKSEIRVYGKVKNNYYLNKMDQIDEDIKKSYEDLEVLSSLIYPVVYTILTGKKLSRYKDIIQKNEFLYKSVLEVSEYAMKKLECVLEEINSVER
ncbi:motility associated factor glycosyltransferase family protein [Clostridium massiliodielmoense]|uniref:motility associated factor glycosyltransferase family protein n=1 Tax=Clostridium massiliodielmoense TaxID=1776385 RepID=UPI0004D4D3BC|nr:6-hydroxymethylpterin diphosphokinase MptE-like protein [Clostridium massiliodielmoense]KEH98107.1 hypothetical protein Z962_12895 [Clostridium botulinum C/D str. BKT12695]